MPLEPEGDLDSELDSASAVVADTRDKAKTAGMRAEFPLEEIELRDATYSDRFLRSRCLANSSYA